MKETDPGADKAIMELRSEVRVTVEQTVRLTCLGRNHHVIIGRAVDLSGRGIRILIPGSPGRLAPGDPVRIDVGDAFLLGEVCYCRPDVNGFMAGVQIDQALSGLADLARRNHALLGGRVILPVSEQA